MVSISKIGNAVSKSMCRICSYDKADIKIGNYAVLKIGVSYESSIILPNNIMRLKYRA